MKTYKSEWVLYGVILSVGGFLFLTMSVAVFISGATPGVAANYDLAPLEYPILKGLVLSIITGVLFLLAVFSFSTADKVADDDGH